MPLRILTMSALGLVCESEEIIGEVWDEETLIFWTLLGEVLGVFFEDLLARFLGGELRLTWLKLFFSPDPDSVIIRLFKVEQPNFIKNKNIN